MRKELALLLSAAVAWITPATGQEAPQVGTPHFQTGTRMVLVPVVVRDHEGRTVSDLSRENFQLLDKGREQPIASFSVERESPGAASSAAPAQFITYFFDDLSLHDFGQLRPAAVHQLSNLRDDDRVAIFSSSCRLALDFTGDRAKLEEVIARLGPAPSPVCQLSPLLPLRIALLKAVVARMAHLPGTKRIVVVSPGLAVAQTEQEAWESLIDRAVEAKVTIDSLHVSQEVQSGMSGTTPDVGHDAAVNMKHVPKFQKLDDRPSRVEAGNLNLLADGTGGTVVEAGNAAEAGLRALSTPDCIYMLGFTPQRPDEGYHKLKVVLKDSRKLNVRARAGYYSTTPLSTSVTSSTMAPEPSEKRVSIAEVLPPGESLAAKRSVEAPEIDTVNRPVTFRARTNLVMVPVVVLNRSGLVVGGLHKSDFQLSDRGQKQEIVSFSEDKLERPAVPASPLVAPAATASTSAAKIAAAATPDRFTAYVFDDVHLRFGDLSQVREAVWQYIRNSAGPWERLALVTTSRKVYTKFTDDLDTLHAALFKITAMAMYRSVCSSCGDLSFFLGNKIAMGDTAALQEAVQRGLALTPAERLAGVCRDMPPPARPACLLRVEMKTKAAADRAVGLGERETSLSLDALRDIVRLMSAMAGRRTIVLVSHGFLVPGDQQLELEHTIDWALRSGVTIQTLDSFGLITGHEMGNSPTDDDTVEPTLSVSIGLAREAGAETLRTLAESTGGTAIENSNDYLGAVRRLATPPEYRYVLGFTPQNLAADGSFHKLKLTLTNSAYNGFTLQTRRGYYSPKQGEGLPEAAAKAIENAVFSRDDVRDLPVEMRTDVKPAEGSGGELTVSTDIDLKLLHYRKADGRNCQELTAVAAVFDRDGNFVTGKQQTLTLKLRDATMDGLAQKRPETLQTSFALSPGTYLVRLVVHSSEDQTMTEVSTQVDVR